MKEFIFPILMATSAAMIPLSVQAHTRFETSTVSEGVRMLNNLAIGHACGTATRVVGTSAVFPDGIDSSIIADGAAYEGPLTDFLGNWGPNIQPLYSRAAFNEVDEKNGATGNVVGFWAGGGPGMPNNMLTYVPFRVNATNFEATSCAVSVKFYVNIVDVCQITDEASLHDEGVAEFWTHNNLGTIFDRVSQNDDGPAPLTFTRDTANNPLPDACGEGFAVEVRSSAEQINRDMPIMYEGVQIWPAK